MLPDLSFRKYVKNQKTLLNRVINEQLAKLKKQNEQSNKKLLKSENSPRKFHKIEIGKNKIQIQDQS